MGAAPAPGMGERLWNTIRNSAVGYAVEQSLPKVSDALSLHPTETSNSPNYYTHQHQLLAPDAALTPGEQEKHPIATGAAEFAGGLSTPESMLMMAGSGGLGKALSFLPDTAQAVVPRLISGGFSLSQVESALKNVPTFRQALAEGNASEAERIMTHMTLDVAAAALGGQHAVMGEAKPLFPGMDRAVNEFGSKLSNTASSAASKATEAVKAVPAQVKEIPSKVSEHLEERGAAKATEKTDADKEEFFSNIEKSLPATSSHPYFRKDLEVSAQRMKPIHDAAVQLAEKGANTPESGTAPHPEEGSVDIGPKPVDSPIAFRDTADRAIKQLHNEVKSGIQVIKDVPLEKDVLGDVRAALGRNPKAKGGTFIEDGLKALDQYDLSNPTVDEADDIRADMNKVAESVLSENKYDRAGTLASSPKFAALDAAARSIREGVYDKAASYGIEDLKGLRQEEGSLLRVRNATEPHIFKEDQAVPKTGKTSIPRQAAKAAINAVAGTVGGAGGYAVAGIPGAIGAGTAAVGLADKMIGSKLVTPNLTKGELLKAAFDKDVKFGIPNKVEVNLKRPADVPPEKGTQEEIPFGPSRLFDIEHPASEDNSTPLERANAQHEREKPYHDVLDDPLATSADKQGAMEAIRKMRNSPQPKTTTKLKEHGPEKPSQVDLDQNTAKGIQSQRQQYDDILNDPTATSQQKAEAHLELAKIMMKVGAGVAGIGALAATAGAKPSNTNQHQEKKSSDASYQNSVEFTPTKEDIEQFKQWKPTGPSTVKGMTVPGNIDLTKRPLVHHSNGSVSSLYSGSFETDKGEVLVPFVSPDGKMMTAKEALSHYQKTGQMLGIFKTSADADAYADFLHRKQGAFQTWKNGGKYSPSVETHDDWKEPQH